MALNEWQHDFLRRLIEPGGLIVLPRKIVNEELDHLLLQHPEGLVDIVVTDENLHAAFLFDRAVDGPNGQGARATGTRICTIRVPSAPAVRTNADI